MEERAQHQIHVIVLLDIQALSVKHVSKKLLHKK